MLRYTQNLVKRDSLGSLKASHQINSVLTLSSATQRPVLSVKLKHSFSITGSWPITISFAADYLEFVDSFPRSCMKNILHRVVREPLQDLQTSLHLSIHYLVALVH